MNESSEEKKIIIDEDWKTQVEAEKVTAEANRKESAAEDGGDVSQEASSGSSDGTDPTMALPPADFTTIVSMLATQVMLNLGSLPNPMTGKTDINLEQAKHAIDLIEVLQEKTKGNCNSQEEAMLENLLHEFRLAYVACQNHPVGGEEHREYKNAMPGRF